LKPRCSNWERIESTPSPRQLRRRARRAAATGKELKVGSKPCLARQSSSSNWERIERLRGWLRCRSWSWNRSNWERIERSSTRRRRSTSCTSCSNWERIESSQYTLSIRYIDTGRAATGKELKGCALGRPACPPSPAPAATGKELKGRMPSWTTFSG
jgi:hypothetical protein